MKATSEQLKGLGICRPTLVLAEQRLQRNIARMVDRTRRAGVTLRPHFKTHQSAQIGEMFRQAGVSAITVSSITMAAYFIAHGWQDVTVAIPLNPGEIDLVNRLAAKSRLQLLVESPAAVAALAGRLTGDVSLWIELDAGYGRTGIPTEQPERVLHLAQQIVDTPRCRFAGLLTHNGATYRARSREEIIALHELSLARVLGVRAYLQEHGFEGCEISIGDTPAASIVDAFPGVSELRPGNFAFYDLMQVQIGACRSDDVAVAVACPVIAIYPERGQVVVHGGAVHLSKERLEVDGEVIFGYATLLRDGGFGPALTDAPVVSISQEHGVLQMPNRYLEQLQLGDLLLVLPVHSCLTANLFGSYLTLAGEQLSLMPKNFQAT